MLEKLVPFIYLISILPPFFSCSTWNCSISGKCSNIPVKKWTTNIISFGVKRHNRSRFRDAVEEQLLYIDNVVFEIEDQEGDIENVNFHAEVLHNSKNLIISDSYVFSRPHIMIVKDENASTGINYGHINFRELEMEGLYGVTLAIA